MYARVTSVDASKELIDSGIDSFKNDVLSTARGIDGYKGAMLFVDRETGKGIGISLWSSEEARARADAEMNEVRAKTLEAMGVDASAIPSAALYEIAVEDWA
jgi:hypothetical protein